MKLFDYFKSKEMGTHVFYFLKGERTLLQFDFCLEDPDDNWKPYLQISMGYGQLLGVIFCLNKFSFGISVFGKTWNYTKLDGI